MKTIYLAIISRSKGDWAMFTSIQKAAAVCQQEGYRIKIVPHVGDSLLCRGRQNLFAQFLNDPDKPEYLFTLDDDIEVPPQSLVKLIKADKPIIGGFYRLKREFDPEYTTNPATYFAFRPLPKTEFELGVDTPQEVKYISTGCIMMTREFCQDMWDKYPELSYIDNSTKEERRALYMTMIEPDDKEYLSEDWAFCWRASKIGYKLYMHPNVLCNHWGIKSYSSTGLIQDILKWRKANEHSS